MFIRNLRLPTDTLISRYLFTYRNSIHATTDETSSFKMLNRSVQTNLECLRNNQDENYKERLIVNFKGQRNDKLK